VLSTSQMSRAKMGQPMGMHNPNPNKPTNHSPKPNANSNTDL